MKTSIIFYCSGVLLLIILSSVPLASFAQHAYFVESGTIEFEKKVNMFARLKNRVKDSNPFMQKIYDEYRRTQPQFNTSKSVLSFSKEKSTYVFLEEEKPAMGFIASDPWLTIRNEIYRDFTTDSTLAIKKIYDEDYVVKDKKQEILWKLTSETREIAGYPCRRANGLILDSIYVVAFFTELIVPSGGPESFSGLPGMILGLALPHENITWFATKVETTNKLKNTPVQFPKRAKQFTRKEYEEDLQKNMKNWGEWGLDAMKAFLL